LHLLFITFSVVDFALRWRKRFASDAFEDTKTISAGFYFTGLETRKYSFWGFLFLIKRI